MSGIATDPGKYATVQTSDGSTWWVNDYPFAIEWLRERGWLVVYDLAFGNPYTIRAKPETQHLDGLALGIDRVKPVTKQELDTLRAAAIQNFYPRSAA